MSDDIGPDNEHDLHVTPVTWLPGTREHELTRRCWCGPRPADEDPRRTGAAKVWVHNERTLA